MRGFISCLALLAAMCASMTSVEADCKTAILKSGACAVMFKGKDCTGTAKESYAVPYGAGNVAKGFEKYESVLVVKGNSFRAYEKEGNSSIADNWTLVEKLAKKEIVTANVTTHKSHNFSKKIKGKVELTACTKGTEKACPAVPEFLCAICYDEINCDEGDWSPLDIPISPKNHKLSGGPKNGIESCSVRAGCTLTLIDTDRIGDSGDLKVSATGKDNHFNLKGNKNKAYAKISDDAEEVTCTCGSQAKPVFKNGINKK